MKVLILLVSSAVCCLAQRPQPCASPLMMSGGLSVSTQDEKLMVYGSYSYDAIGKRIRIKDLQSLHNESFHLDILLLYKQGYMFKFSEKYKTCVKRRLTESFQPLAIPQDALLLSQAVLGSSSIPGEGIFVNLWSGELKLRKEPARYVSSVTQLGCVPVGTLISRDRRGWMAVSFFNNIIGWVNPEDFAPPDYCRMAHLEEEEEEALMGVFSFF